MSPFVSSAHRNDMRRRRWLADVFLIAGLLGTGLVCDLAFPWPVLLLPQLAVSIFVICPVYFRLRARAEPPPRGKCECGYDLRATPVRCPECGRIVRHRAWYES